MSAVLLTFDVSPQLTAALTLQPMVHRLGVLPPPSRPPGSPAPTPEVGGSLLSGRCPHQGRPWKLGAQGGAGSLWGLGLCS